MNVISLAVRPAGHFLTATYHIRYVHSWLFQHITNSKTAAMAPIRRYLRITKYSVLECRLYLDNPALAHSWLLNPRNPVLPRVIDAVRPLVLPKLREERERSRKRSTKKKGIKDVVVEGVSTDALFLC